MKETFSAAAICSRLDWQLYCEAFVLHSATVLSNIPNVEAHGLDGSSARVSNRQIPLPHTSQLELHRKPRSMHTGNHIFAVLRQFSGGTPLNIRLVMHQNGSIHPPIMRRNWASTLGSKMTNRKLLNCRCSWLSVMLRRTVFGEIKLCWLHHRRTTKDSNWGLKLRIFFLSYTSCKKVDEKVNINKGISVKKLPGAKWDFCSKGLAS